MICKDNIFEIPPLRIITTSICQHNCIYCHREGTKERCSQLAPSEIGSISKVLSILGINKVKLTGGEPLLRSDITSIIKNISGLNSINDISVTTNGVLLANKAKEIAEAGLTKVTVSLNSVNPMKHEYITGSPDFEKIVRGIEVAYDYGFSLKINCVLLKNINDSEILPMIDFAEKYGAEICFMDLLPQPFNSIVKKHYYDSRNVITLLNKTFPEKEYWTEMKSIPRICFQINNTKVSVKCSKNNRKNRPQMCMVCPFDLVCKEGLCGIRLTLDGTLKPCLLRDDNTLNILEIIKKSSVPDVVEYSYKYLKNIFPSIIAPTTYSATSILME